MRCRAISSRSWKAGAPNFDAERPGLPAPGGPWLGLPRRDRRLGEPDGQATPLAERGVVFSPVRHPVPLFRDVVPAIGIRLERQSGCP